MTQHSGDGLTGRDPRYPEGSRGDDGREQPPSQPDVGRPCDVARPGHDVARPGYPGNWWDTGRAESRGYAYPVPGLFGGPDPEPEPDPARFRLEPRTAVLVASGFLTVLLAAVLTLLPVPYAILAPGPTYNTLGEIDGKALITVSGHRTYPAEGELDLTTVSLSGGPGDRVYLLSALQGWISGEAEVVPEEVLFPPGQTEEEEEKIGRAQMVTSQESATAAALEAIDVQVPVTLTVSEEDARTPASRVLKGGDVILAVDGRRVGDLDELGAVVSGLTAGEQTEVRVRRSGRVEDLRVTTTKDEEGKTILGIYVEPDYRFPFDVTISIDNVGGPSAGLMFALGIVDTLTEGDLTGGRTVAGTGSIDPDGTVGAIGGIRQKLIGARRGGAEWFLAPSDNCSEVVGHVPDGLRVVPVSTLDDALTAVRTIASGQGADGLRSCTAQPGS